MSSVSSLINSSSLSRAAAAGIAVGAIEEAINENGRESVMSGLTMGAASLISDVGAFYWGWNGNFAEVAARKPLMDAVVFTALEALKRDERNARDTFRNFLISFGSSFVSGQILPFTDQGFSYVSGALPGAVIVPVQQTVPSGGSGVPSGAPIVSSSMAY